MQETAPLCTHSDSIILVLHYPPRVRMISLHSPKLPGWLIITGVCPLMHGCCSLRSPWFIAMYIHVLMKFKYSTFDQSWVVECTEICYACIYNWHLGCITPLGLFYSQCAPVLQYTWIFMRTTSTNETLWQHSQISPHLAFLVLLAV